MIDFVGSGPYCFSNSLAMVLGLDAPAPGVIETLTGSPFGMQLIAGSVPLFDPYGWHPETGLDAAVELLGRRCERSDGGTPEEALARLRSACASGPALVGPLDMGLLLYQPGTPNSEGGDHYVVVLSADEEHVLLHDPHGHPYATMPTKAFLTAWEAKSISYIDAPFVLRTGFVRERAVTETQALRWSFQRALKWLAGRDDLPMPTGSLGGAEAAEHLAATLADGLPEATRGLLTGFAVRVGARRRADAATCLNRLGMKQAAAIATHQAQLIGSLQYQLVTHADRQAADVLRHLAPTYPQLHTALSSDVAAHSSHAG
ncbi:hypothetical protein ACFV2H_33835 [Streptomyces sp. NPDC059629]|uniref:hypothetical protein n=1 Tax=Streptomyces sp. NPDC059629 TaxID=3346889 RepID=UPI0036AA40BF